ETLLDEMYVSNAVKRPIYRTMDIVKDIKHVFCKAPKKIFIEMARGGGKKGVRTKSRKDQIRELYKTIDQQEIRELSEQLEEKSDNELQREVLFLYFMQLGKSAYSNTTLDIDKLNTNLYNVDHIYPQSKVKDDSIDNKVLVLSQENGDKGDSFPINREIREKRTPYWSMLKKYGLISTKKYERLTRNTPFSEDELMGFIHRQIVETRQSTKAVATILQNMFPDTEIIYSRSCIGISTNI
ncbi:MAG: type II CRISPR RNA-guided endonuclease Cas9, partial [Lachnospiraceae bacterium]|nr:type II CRISPR RNA-guided endonuclease Cas9 [Lachnospiraceae bacterium]